MLEHFEEAVNTLGEKPNIPTYSGLSIRVGINNIYSDPYCDSDYGMEYQGYSVVFLVSIYALEYR